MTDQSSAGLQPSLPALMTDFLSFFGDWDVLLLFFLSTKIGFGELGLSLWVFRVTMNVRVIAMKENNAQKTPLKSDSRDF